MPMSRADASPNFLTEYQSVDPMKGGARPRRLYLSGRTLLLARAVWGLLAVVMFAFFVANLPVYFVQLRTICSQPGCPRWQLTPATAHAIERVHLSPTVYALLSLIFTIVTGLIWYATAAVIMWRQSRQWLAMLISMLLIAQQGTIMSGTALAPLDLVSPAWHAVTVAFGILPILFFMLTFAVFPTGRFVPGWMRWSILLLPLALWAYAVEVGSTQTPLLALNPLPVLVFLAGIFAIIAAQIHRFRRVSTLEERQQTKWVLLSLAVIAPMNFLYFILPLQVPTLDGPDSLYFLLARLAYNLLWLVFPLALGTAILRYHLMDIDLIIRKALVYIPLTGVLGGLYVGSIVGLQSLVEKVNSAASHSPVIIVATTLLIAALITPLRRNIQAGVDRRFYRRKYDAAQTLERFSASLRHETSLPAVRQLLLAAVEETMHPSHVSLWLRDAAAPYRRQRSGGSLVEIAADQGTTEPSS